MAEVVLDSVGKVYADGTRAVTDLEWRPPELQVGQTGTTVSPQLYLASGVSGATCS